MTVFGNDETNADDTFSKLAGDLADGTITAALTSGLHPSPELVAFREAYKKKFNLESTPFAETSYDSIMMFAQVLTEAQRRPSRTRCGRSSRRPRASRASPATLGFSEKDHITITKDQISLVKYDAASGQWVEVME